METCFGGYLLVIGGYSYRRKSIASERSYWFCCSPKCSAKGVLHSNGDFHLTNGKHNHEPAFEDIKKREKLIELKKLALEVNVSGHHILEALGIKEDVKKYLSFIRTWRSRNEKKKQNARPKSNSVVQVGLNYKRLASRTSSKEMIFHSGFLYRQDSINPLNSQCKYWRCRVKNCKARAKTDEMDNLTILNSDHIHQPDDGEGALREFRQMLKTEASHSSKSVAEIIKEHNVKSDNLKKYIRKVRQNAEKGVPRPSGGGDGALVPAKNARPAAGPTQFCSSTPDSEIFSIEKLMAETFEENYGIASEFHAPFTFIKN